VLPLLSARGAGGAVASPEAALLGVDWRDAERLTVTMVDFSFAPDHLELRAGVPYRLRLRNQGERAHGFHASGFFAAIALGGVRAVPFAGPVQDPAAAGAVALTTIDGRTVVYLPVAAAAAAYARAPARQLLEAGAASAPEPAAPAGDGPNGRAAVGPETVEDIRLEPYQEVEIDLVPIARGAYPFRSSLYGFVRGMYGRITVD